MKKLITVLLLISMLFVLLACSKEDSREPSVLGTWEGSMDIGPAVAASLQTELQIEVPIRITYVLKEDNRHTFTIDEEGLVGAVENIAETAMEVYAKYYEDLGLSFEETLAEQGMSLDEYKSQLLSSAELEAMIMMLLPDHSGYYKYESGKLCFAETKKDFDAEEYSECDYVIIDGDTMTITDMEIHGDKLSEFVPEMFPIVFTRQQ